MRRINRVGFIIKPHAPRVEKILADLVKYFEKKEISYYFEREAAEKLKKQQGQWLVSS